MRGVLIAVGGRTRAALALVGRLTRLHAALLRLVARLPRLNLRLLGKITTNQVRFSGLQATPLIAALATSIGAVSIIQSFGYLTGVADEFIGGVLVSIIVRELGPLVTAIVLIARSGTAMAAEIGWMRLNGEIDALEAYRIDPLAFIVLPRVVAAAVSMLALIIVFDVLGIIGGFSIAFLLTDLSFPLLWSRVTSALTNMDVALTVLKAVLFGETVAALCCHFGLNVKQSPTELPQAVTKAVVASLAGVFLIDGALAAAFFL